VLPLLSVQQLQVSFGDKQAVGGISFSLQRGKVLGIVGESGSGKSLTALSIMRLSPDTARMTGSISLSLDGESAIELNTAATRAMQHIRGKHIGMIFQEPTTSLNPVHRCGDQVREVLTLHGLARGNEAREKVISLFKEVELPDPERMYRAYPHELSGGQKQRVMIAMAVACSPALLLADEPTTALDVTVQQGILALIRRLQQERGMSVIFISHDLGLVAGLADEVAVMYRGEIVEVGPTKAIFNAPQHPYTQGLLACRPRMDMRVQNLPTVADFMAHGSTPPVRVTEGSWQERQTALRAREPLLRVEGLSTHFRRDNGLLAAFGKQHAVVKAVSNVALTIYPGETLGLVGESGSGKTTLGRSILRLIEPVAGNVFFGNTALTALNKADMRAMRRNMQLIFQDPFSSLNPRKTIGEAILEPMQVHGLHTNDTARRQKVLEWLERVGLSPDSYHRYPHAFSGGQRQRACIARALAVEPRFVVCDECVSALDVSVQAQVLNLLRALQTELGLTYLFISHDLSVVRHLSDRIAVMKDGQLLELGDADSICDSPQHPYTQRLLAAVQ